MKKTNALPMSQEAFNFKQTFQELFDIDTNTNLQEVVADILPEFFVKLAKAEDVKEYTSGSLAYYFEHHFDVPHKEVMINLLLAIVLEMFQPEHEENAKRKLEGLITITRIGMVKKLMQHHKDNSEAQTTTIQQMVNKLS